MLSVFWMLLWRVLCQVAKKKLVPLVIHIAGWKIIDRRTKKTHFDEQSNEQGTVPLGTSAQDVCGDGGKITVFLFSFLFFVCVNRSPIPRSPDPRSSILDPALAVNPSDLQTPDVILNNIEYYEETRPQGLIVFLNETRRGCCRIFVCV